MAKIDSSQQPSTMEQRAAEKWRLLPREHGAYAQILFPLLTALALGGGSSAQFYWVIAAVAVFIVHEPLLILVGERGRRSHTELAGDAQRLAGGLSLAALAMGILGWWHAPQSARIAMTLPLSLGFVLFVLILRHREKTLLGELLVSLTFSTMLIPVALAGAVTLEAALTASAVWIVIFSLATVTVRAVIANLKKATRGRRPAYASEGLSFAIISVSLILLLTDGATGFAAAAVLPAALITLACSFAGVHPRHLRELGWCLVGSNVIALAVLVLGLR